MACSKAEDLINQLIEATLKLLDFGLNIMDALRVQKLLTIRNQKIGLISDEACLPECSLRFSLNFDLMMFNKLLRTACLRARATLNELRVCRLRYPNAPLVLEPKTKVKFQKLQKKIAEFDEAVRADKMIARRDLRDFREIAIIFSQLEHDLKLLICSLECASTMKDTVLFAAPITDVMTVLSIVLNRLEHLAQKAEIDEKIAAAEQQKATQDQKIAPTSATRPIPRPPSTSPVTRTRNPDVLFHGQNTNRTAQQRRQDMTAMIAAASQQNFKSSEHRREKKPIQIDTPQTTQSEKYLNHSHSIEMHTSKHQSKLPRHINHHYKSITSTLPRHLKSDNIPSNHHHHIKQHRNEFIRKWTNDARNTYAQNHLIPSSNPMTSIDLKRKDRHRQKSIHHHSSSSSLLNNSETSSSILNELYKTKTKEQSSSSISLTSISNIEEKNPSSNNSANIYLQSHEANDNLECQIS